MFNGFLVVTLGKVYFSKDVVTLADNGWFAVFWEEGDRMGCGFFCGIDPVVLKGQHSKQGKALGLSRCVLELFENFQRLFCLMCRFLKEAGQSICVGRVHQRHSSLIKIPSASPELDGVVK